MAMQVLMALEEANLQETIEELIQENSNSSI